jgi:hypothetical protein
MTCPRCGTTVRLNPRDRQGIVVETCPRCRGVWLDRDQLDRLLARAAAEVHDLESRVPRFAAAGRLRFEEEERDDDHQRRRWFHALGEPQGRRIPDAARRRGAQPDDRAALAAERGPAAVLEPIDEVAG